MTVKTAVTRAATTAVKVAVEAVEAFEAVNPKKARGSRQKKSLSPVEEVIDQLGMRWSEKQKQKYMKRIKVVELKRLEVPYPTDNYYMASTAAGKDQWERFSYKKPLRDKRYNHGKRREILLLDESKLQYIIPQDESVIFRDADTKDIFMVILRDFIPDDELREDMIATCRQILRYRRDDRREDPGQLVHFGYTCGGRHKPTVGLAANRRYISPKDHRELNNACQGMAGIGWNMLRSRLPQLIIDDYNECIKSIPGCPRMDMEPTKGVKDDLFAYNVGGRDLTFNEAGDLELPPPSGLSAVNYARFTHRENNGNEWFIAATLLAADSPAIGGNFYNASYGIVMEAASNTVSCFKPQDYHGTTLYEIVIPDGVWNPSKPEWRIDSHERRPDGGENIGFAFEVSKGLANARRKKEQREAAKPGRGGKRIRRKVFGSEPDSDAGSDEDYYPTKRRG
ncbi:hypothetical protein LQW54_004276 [Pestalotiopsis sp. IQ-011]